MIHYKNKVLVSEPKGLPKSPSESPKHAQALSSLDFSSYCHCHLPNNPFTHSHLLLPPLNTLAQEPRLLSINLIFPEFLPEYAQVSTFVREGQGLEENSESLEASKKEGNRRRDLKNMEEDKEQRIHGVQTKVSRRKETQTSFIEELNDYKGYFSEFLPSQIQEAEKRVVHYKCKVDGCSKVFERAQNIAMHMRMHFNIKKYKCDYCQRRFIQKGNRDKHLKQHITPKLEERKVIPCSLCNGMFTEKHNLQFHMRQKHGIQNPFKQ